MHKHSSLIQRKIQDHRTAVETGVVAPFKTSGKLQPAADSEVSTMPCLLCVGTHHQAQNSLTSGQAPKLTDGAHSEAQRPALQYS